MITTSVKSPLPSLDKPKSTQQLIPLFVLLTMLGSLSIYHCTLGTTKNPIIALLKSKTKSHKLCILELN